MKQSMDLIFDFTRTYSKEWIEAHKEMIYMDCTDLRGTDMYCSPDSATELERRIAKYPLAGIHFIDSGNYHYMTRLFTKRIQKPYVLVFFDNHTDCKPSMIPELLSCGAWAKQVLEEDGFLQKMILIGPPQKAIDEIAAKNREKLITVSMEELSGISDPEGMDSFLNTKISAGNLAFPLYISIDKDVLSEEYALTNWDQGELSIKQLKALLGFFLEAARENGEALLGVDICGELPQKEAASIGEWAQAQSVNQRTNEEEILFFRGYFANKCIKNQEESLWSEQF